MKRPASDVAFTPAVKAVQERRGSRASFARMEEKGGMAHRHHRRTGRLSGRDTLVLPRHRQCRGATVYPASGRAAGVFARARPAHARLCRFHRQPPVYHHRQSRREPTRGNLRYGLRAAPPPEAVGQGAAGGRGRRAAGPPLAAGLRGTSRSKPSYSTSKPGTAIVPSIFPSCSRPQMSAKPFCSFRRAFANWKMRSHACAPKPRPHGRRRRGGRHSAEPPSTGLADS